MAAIPIIPFVFMLLKLTGDITYSPRLLRPNNSQLKNDFTGPAMFSTTNFRNRGKNDYTHVLLFMQSCTVLTIMFDWNTHINVLFTEYYIKFYIIFRTIIC